MGIIRQSTHTIMNTLVVLVALVGCALAQAPAPVQDTPEVAAAKAHFFAAYNAAAHASYAAPDIDVQYADNEHNVVIPHHAAYYGHPGYYGYSAFPAYHGYPYAYGYHGYPYTYVPADTPEVHAAKDAHFAAYNKIVAEHAAIDHTAEDEPEEGRGPYVMHTQDTTDTQDTMDTAMDTMAIIQLGIIKTFRTYVVINVHCFCQTCLSGDLNI